MRQPGAGNVVLAGPTTASCRPGSRNATRAHPARSRVEVDAPGCARPLAARGPAASHASRRTPRVDGIRRVRNCWSTSRRSAAGYRSRPRVDGFWSRVAPGSKSKHARRRCRPCVVAARNRVSLRETLWVPVVQGSASVGASRRGTAGQVHAACSPRCRAVVEAETACTSPV